MFMGMSMGIEIYSYTCVHESKLISVEEVNVCASVGKYDFSEN